MTDSSFSQPTSTTMTDPRLSWPTLAENTPEPGVYCDWFDARSGGAGSGSWYVQGNQFDVAGFVSGYGVVTSDPATTHWRPHVAKERQSFSSIDLDPSAEEPQTDPGADGIDLDVEVEG